MQRNCTTHARRDKSWSITSNFAHLGESRKILRVDKMDMRE